jgi:hypothetical protein
MSKVDHLCEIYRYFSVERDENGKQKALRINASFSDFCKVKDQIAAALSKQVLENTDDK